MEAHRSLYFQGSSASQLSTPGASGALSSSLPVHLSSFEEKYPSLPDSLLLYMQRELNANPMAFYSSLPYNGVVGPIVPLTSGFSNEFDFSFVGPPENHSRKSPCLSQLSNAGTSLPLTTCHSRMLQSTLLNNCGSWFTDPLSEFFDDPVNTPIKINQFRRNNNGGCPIPSEDHSKRNYWQGCVDQLINDDSLTSNWNDRFVDSNVDDLQSKVAISSLNNTLLIWVHFHFLYMHSLFCRHSSKFAILPFYLFIFHP